MSEKSWEVQLEEKIKKLEKEMKAMGRQVEAKAKVFEEKAEQLGRDLESKVEDHAKHSKTPSGAAFFWGLVFIVAGFIWLGNEMGWFYHDVPWVPLFLIVGGAYMLIKYWGDSQKKEDDTL